jgi:hypothetical protein
MSKCLRPYCKGRIFDGECLLCCRAPEGTTPEPLDIPTDKRLTTPYRRRTKPLGITKERNRRLRDELVAYVMAHPGEGAYEIATALRVQLAPMQGRLKTACAAGLLRHEGRGTSNDPYCWYVEEIGEEAS